VRGLVRDALDVIIPRLFRGKPKFRPEVSVALSWNDIAIVERNDY